MIKILIIRLSSLGDIVHTFPMIYDIKANLPNCEIDWLVDEEFQDIVKFCPYIDNIIKIPLRKWKKNKLQAILKFLKWKKALEQKKYDYIIDAQGLMKSAFLAKYFQGDTHGFAAISAKEKIASKFYKYIYNIDNNCMAVTKNRLLAASIFQYKINHYIADFGLKCKRNPNILDRYIIFFHATSKKSKNYDNNNWATLADYLIKSYSFKIILPFGNDNEKEDAIVIKNLVDSEKVIVCNKVLDYFALKDLICNADFIFGVDTGLVHLANALHKKTIAIYTDTDPGKTGIFESKVAKNIGGINKPPLISELIDIFEKIENK